MSATRMLLVLMLVALPSRIQGQQAELGLYHQVLIVKTSGVFETSSFNNLQGYVYLGKKGGLWGYAYQETNYLSGIVGIYYDFSDWFEIGVGAGRESLKEDDGLTRGFSRYAGTMQIGSGKTLISIYFENGNRKDYWYQVDAMWRPNDNFGAGVFAQRGAGIGPRVLVRVPILPVEAWVAPAMYDTESHQVNHLFGLQLVLKNEKKDS